MQRRRRLRRRVTASSVPATDSTATSTTSTPPPAEHRIGVRVGEDGGGECLVDEVEEHPTQVDAVPPSGRGVERQPADGGLGLGLTLPVGVDGSGDAEFGSWCELCFGSFDRLAEHGPVDPATFVRWLTMPSRVMRAPSGRHLAWVSESPSTLPMIDRRR
jgi:hypothetical protein